MVSTISATATSEKVGKPGPQRKRQEPLSPVVLPPGRDHLRRPVRGPDVRVVLLLPHPLDPVRHRVHRVRQLRRRSSPSRPCADRFINTFIYGFLTSAAEGRARPAARRCCSPPRSSARGYLRAVVFFPVLVSTIGIGITFKVLMDPFDGLINQSLAVFGITGPGWLTDPYLALYTRRPGRRLEGRRHRHADLHRRASSRIPQEYYEAARIDGAGAWQIFRHITLPLVRPATATVIILSLIGGLRSFELIWAMTSGGPGFSSDVLALRDLQAVPGRLLRPVHRRQRHPVPGRDAAIIVPTQRRSAGSHREEDGLDEAADRSARALDSSASSRSSPPS